MTLLIHIVLTLFTILAVLHFILMFMSSITDESMIFQNGYSFIPDKLSADAYRYVLVNLGQIGSCLLYTSICSRCGSNDNLDAGHGLINRRCIPARTVCGGISAGDASLTLVFYPFHSRCLSACTKTGYNIGSVRWLFSLKPVGLERKLAAALGKSRAGLSFR